MVIYWSVFITEILVIWRTVQFLRFVRAESEKQNIVLPESKKGKQARVWDLSGNAKTDIDSLDYSEEKSDNAVDMTEFEERKFVEEQVMNYNNKIHLNYKKNPIF